MDTGPLVPSQVTQRSMWGRLPVKLDRRPFKMDQFDWTINTEERKWNRRVTSWTAGAVFMIRIISGSNQRVTADMESLLRCMSAECVKGNSSKGPPIIYENLRNIIERYYIQLLISRCNLVREFEHATSNSGDAVQSRCSGSSNVVRWVTHRIAQRWRSRLKSPTSTSVSRDSWDEGKLENASFSSAVQLDRVSCLIFLALSRKDKGRPKTLKRWSSWKDGCWKMFLSIEENSSSWQFVAQILSETRFVIRGIIAIIDIAILLWDGSKRKRISKVRGWTSNCGFSRMSLPTSCSSSMCA